MKKIRKTRVFRGFFHFFSGVQFGSSLAFGKKVAMKRLAVSGRFFWGERPVVFQMGVTGGIKNRPGRTPTRHLGSIRWAAGPIDRRKGPAIAGSARQWLIYGPLADAAALAMWFMSDRPAPPQHIGGVWRVGSRSWAFLASVSHVLLLLLLLLRFQPPSPQRMSDSLKEVPVVSGRTLSLWKSNEALGAGCSLRFSVGSDVSCSFAPRTELVNASSRRLVSTSRRETFMEFRRGCCFVRRPSSSSSSLLLLLLTVFLLLTRPVFVLVWPC